MGWIPVLRESSCADVLMVDPELGLVATSYASDGSVYTYENVSTAAIHNLLNDKDLSVGEWINEHLKKGGVDCRYLSQL